MNKTEIYISKKIKPRNPIMLVGLPGIASVGSLVCEHIRNELNAERFATLYSPYFPYQVFMLPSGYARLVSNRFYFWKNPSTKKGARDLIILTGDTQAVSSEGQYDVNERIVKFFKKLGGKTIYTIGGYHTGAEYIGSPKTYGATTSKNMIKNLEKNGVIFGKAAGSIAGSAGLILAFAKKHKIEATCLMGETGGFLDVDANAAKSVLNSLIKILGLKISLENIDKIKTETERVLKEFEEAAKGQTQPPSNENFTYIR
mgnify:CR=1 FL=1